MAQVRFHNYQRPVDSFQENRRLLGILQPGRYRGFDGIVSYVALGAIIGHSGSGINQTDSDNTTQTGPTAVWVAPIGTIVHETGSLASLAFASNAANNFERIDAVYGEHQWLASVGGQAATYGVTQGANGGPVKPVVANDKIQVILGYMHIPANASDLSAATWETASIPNIANADIIINNPVLDTRYARLAFANTFSSTQYWKQATTFGGISSGAWTPDPTGNTYVATGLAPVTITKIADQQNGSRILLYNPINTGQTISLSLNTANSTGFKGIRCQAWQDLTSGNTMIIAEETGVVLEKINGQWEVIDFSAPLAANLLNLRNTVTALSTSISGLVSVPVGAVIAYDGNFIDFNNTGLGINTMTHWAVCNGLNGTRDRRGRTIVGAISGVPATGAPALGAEVDPTTAFEGINPPNYAVGDAGGKPHHTLIVGELPAHNHNLTVNDGAGPMGTGTNPGKTNSGTDSIALTTTNTGGGDAHTNLPPYLAAAWIQRIS